MTRRRDKVSAYEAAIDYLQRGWEVMKLPPRSKSPYKGKSFVANTITLDNVSKLAESDNNIGVIFRTAGELKDLDCDFRSAADLAHAVRMEGASFGRPSGGFGHYLFNAPGCEAKRFELPGKSGEYPRPLPIHNGEPSGLVLEIRGNDNTYTMFPPSVHPCGETIAWNGSGREPANTTAAELRLRAGRHAFCAAVLYFYPKDAPARYDLRMALTGALSRCGMSADIVTTYVQAVAKLGGDPKWEEDFAERTEQRLREDQRVTGLTKLIEVLQLPKTCLSTFHDWIGVGADIPEGVTLLDPSDPITSARILVAEHFTKDGMQTLWRHRECFFLWTGSYYQIANDETLRAHIWTFLEKAQRRGKNGPVPFKPTPATVGATADALRAVCVLNEHIDPPSWISRAAGKPAAMELFACSNGLLHLPSGKLHAATPDFFNLNASTAAYDRKAKAPLWQEFLAQLFGSDRQAIKLMQNWSGYALSPDTSQQKILGLIGPKRSGKGTFARLLTEMLGMSSVAGPTMHSLGEMFGLEPLITKSLAIISDVRIGKHTGTSTITERLLSISGEDRMTVHRKNTTAWHGKMPTRIMFMSNELLSLNDVSGAFSSRLMLLILNNSFYGKEDTELTNKLKAELSGVLNWAIRGYRALKADGHFIQPKSSYGAIDDIETLGAPVKAFIRDQCEVGAGRRIVVDTLYQRWREWCIEEGRKDPGTKEWFGRNLHSAVPGLRVSRPRKGKERDRYYEGVTAITETDEEKKRKRFVRHGDDPAAKPK